MADEFTNRKGLLRDAERREGHHNPVGGFEFAAL